MNRIRVLTSGMLFLFALYCLFFNPTLPFSLPIEIDIIAFIYFAFFPMKDMLSIANPSLYKGRQFKKHYIPNHELQQQEFIEMKRRYDYRAISAFVFWVIFMAVPGSLYLLGYIDKIWIFVFFALSNFSVFFAIFGWCPFHSIFIKPECCMECRIYNWDSFFQYSFLIFIPNVMTVTLFLLGLLSLIEWEVTYARHPERFYKMSNANLTCEHCDLDACRQHKKKRFHKTLKEEYYQNKI
jgi:hypothetical protein